MKLLNLIAAGLIVLFGLKFLNSNLLNSALASNVSVDGGQFAGLWAAAIIISIVGCVKMWTQGKAREHVGERPQRPEKNHWPEEE